MEQRISFEFSMVFNEKCGNSSRNLQYIQTKKNNKRLYVHRKLNKPNDLKNMKWGGGWVGGWMGEKPRDPKFEKYVFESSEMRKTDVGVQNWEKLYFENRKAIFGNGSSKTQNVKGWISGSGNTGIQDSRFETFIKT